MKPMENAEIHALPYKYNVPLSQRWWTCGPQKNFVRPAKHFRRDIRF